MLKSRKKQRTIFILIITLFVILITSSVLLIVFINNGTLSLIFGLLLIACFSLLIYLRSKFDYYKHLFQYESLFKNIEEPIMLKKTISLDYIKKSLLNQGFRFSDVFDDTHILAYKIDKSFSKNSKNNILFAALIILNSNQAFSDSKSNIYFQKLEQKISGEEKYLQRIFYQIKLIDNHDENTYEDSKNIFFITAKREHIVLLNILFQTDANSIFFVHSKTYHPNQYFKLAVDNVRSIFK